MNTRRRDQEKPERKMKWICLREVFSLWTNSEPSSYFPLYIKVESEETAFGLKTIENPSFIRVYNNSDFFLNFPSV